MIFHAIDTCKYILCIAISLADQTIHLVLVDTATSTFRADAGSIRQLGEIAVFVYKLGSMVAPGQELNTISSSIHEGTKVHSKDLILESKSHSMV